MYVADSGSFEVRKVGAAGVSTLAGNAATPGIDDGTGPLAAFIHPHATAVDAAGNAYVTDNGSGQVRKITPAGVVTTLLHRGSGPPTTGDPLQITQPESVGVDAAGNVYVADGYDGKVAKITPAGAISVVLPPSGDPMPSFFVNDPDWFRHPVNLAVAADGTVWVSDTTDSVIRRITPDGQVTVVAGTMGVIETTWTSPGGGPVLVTVTGNADGVGGSASFNAPGMLALDGGGNAFVLDQFNQVIRKITPAGVVTTVASLNGPVLPVGYPGEPWTYGSSITPGSFDWSYDLLSITERQRGAVVGLAVAPGGALIVSSTQSNCLHQGRAVVRPVVALGAPVVTRTTATLNASVNPNGLATAVQVDYGTDPALGSSLSLAFTANDTASHPVQAALSGLSPDTVYYYRVTAVNIDGATTVAGMFTTPDVRTTALAGLEADAGPLVPAFDPAVTIYDLTTASGSTAVVLTPVLADAAATVTINGVAALSGSPSAPVATGPGRSSIMIQVTAEDGVTHKTYVVIAHPLSHAQEWRLRYFGQTENIGIAADLADPDGDGVSNLTEFATGTDPTLRSRPPGVTAVEGANLSFTYTRSNAAVADGVAFTVEWTTTLPGKAWSTAGVTETVLSDDGTLQTVKALVPRKGSRALFLHLRIDPP